MVCAELKRSSPSGWTEPTVAGMKALVSVLCLGVGSTALAVQEVIPAPLPASRYEKMLEKSPFTLATPVAAPVIPQAGYASTWYVTGIAQLDNKDFVSIKSQDLSTQFTLYGNEEHQETGVTLVGVDWQPTFLKSTVTIKKGSEFAKLEFDKAAVQSMQVTTPNPGLNNRPGNPLQPGGRNIIPRPAGALGNLGGGQNTPVQNTPITNTPVTNMPGANQTNLNPTAVQPGTGAAPAAGENRRRMRVVPRP